jgi:transposase
MDGSINDSSFFTFMLENAAEVGISKVKYIVDRAFFTNFNLQYLENNNLSYITAMPKSLKDFSIFIDTFGHLVKKSCNRIEEYENFGLSVDYQKENIKLKAHIFFNTEKYQTEENNLFEHIKTLEHSLNNFNKTKPFGKQYSDFFQIQYKSDQTLSYTRDHEKTDIIRNRLGFFILVTNDLELDSLTILSMYKKKDLIEKQFHGFKNDLDFDRARTHLSKTTSGKFFIGFIALILRSFLLTMIRSNKSLKKMTVDRSIIHLQRIKAFVKSDLSIKYSPLTKTQKLVLDAIRVSSEKLLNTNFSDEKNCN